MAAVAKYAPLAAKVGYWYALATMDSHSNVVCGQQYQSNWFAALGNVTSLYRYVFSHATTDWPQRVLNATHTAELPYLFRNVSVLDWYLGYRSFSDKERVLSDGLATAWANFARSGDPNPAIGERISSDRSSDRSSGRGSGRGSDRRSVGRSETPSGKGLRGTRPQSAVQQEEAAGDQIAHRSWKQFGSGGNFTFVFDTAPKSINDGSDWYAANEPYCSFWATRFLGPFPP
jgi:hypothetical protein